MSTLETRLQDPDYYNWFKSTLCLSSLKRGLEEFVDIKSIEFHQKVLRNLANAKITVTGNAVCGTETINFTRKGPNISGKITCGHPFCQGFLKAIIQEGIDPNESFIPRIGNIKNTNVSVWHSKPWEVSKLFMGPGQKKDPQQTKPSETDLSGLINFVAHCRVPRDSISNTQYIGKVRNARNAIFSAFTETSAAELQFYAADMIHLLEDPLFMKTLKGPQAAVIDIKKVLSATFCITEEKAFSVLEDNVTESLRLEEEYYDNDLETTMSEPKKAKLTQMANQQDEKLKKVSILYDASRFKMETGTDLRDNMESHVNRLGRLLEGNNKKPNDLQKEVASIRQKISGSEEDVKNLKSEDKQQNRIPSEEDSKLPEEILRMDSKSIELYKKALEEGKEKDFNIRIMVVGPYGVGKTSFTKRLLFQDVDTTERKSTNGIDVHVNRCKVSLKTGKWTVDSAGTEEDIVEKRLAKILGDPSNTEITGSPSEITESPSENLEIFESTDTHEKEEIGSHGKTNDGSIIEDHNFAHHLDVSNNDFSGLDTVDVKENINADTVNYPSEQEKSLMKDLEKVVAASSTSEKDDKAIVSVWDFGGQSVFYTTHQMFLSHRAIYVLVSNLNQHIGNLVKGDEPYFDCSGEQSLKIEDFIDIWLTSIHGHSKSDRSKEPPVILVGTHTDELEHDSREEQVEAMFDAIRDRFAGKKCSLHFIEKDFGISNATRDLKMEDLRQTIIDVAKQQHYWGELKPVKWIPLEGLLEDKRREGTEIISRAEIEKLNKTLPVPISSDEELELFLRFQHETANIMYFSLGELSGKIVLTPQFLVNALKSLITAEEFCKKKPDILDKWKEFQQKGILLPSLLDAVWDKGENQRFRKNREHVIALMEHLNIIARPIHYTETAPSDDSNTIQQQDCHLVPCMLKESPPDSVFLSEEGYISTPCLCLLLEDIAFPSAIFNRLLVTCMTSWQVARKQNKYRIYCGYGQFEIDRQHRLTLTFKSHVIGLRITKYSNARKHPSVRVCKEVYSNLKRFLKRIGDSLSLVLNYEECVKCPGGEANNFECRFPVKTLKEDDDVTCHGHQTVKTTPSPDMLKYWFDSEETDYNIDSMNATPEQHYFPTDILDKVPTEKELARVASNIGNQFQRLALELGLTQARIDQIRGDNTLDVLTQITKILLEWQKQKGNQATLCKLEKAMHAVGVAHSAAFQKIQDC